MAQAPGESGDVARPSRCSCSHFERKSMGIGHQLSRSQDLSTKSSLVFTKRAEIARERYAEALKTAYNENIRPLMASPAAAASAWTDWPAYAIDSVQRQILFWDTLRQRGNVFIERNREGLPPVLHFAYETIVDGRKLPRPVNYALVRIVPPEGVTIDTRL